MSLRVRGACCLLLAAGSAVWPLVGSDPPAPAVQFEDITAQAGIAFRHYNGAFGKKYLPETMGSGCAFLDYDGDGLLDILLLNGSDWPGRRSRRSFPALYRNLGGGKFTDVTRQAGLQVEMYAMGVAAADYDNDGDTDIYLSGLGPDRLFRNNGKGVFEEVTGDGAPRNPGFGTSSAWLDYDRDGDLDLFVANYVQWSVETDIFCTLDGVNKSYCTPESYRGASSRLFQNRGAGRFDDVTQAAGLFDESAKSLGVAVLDYDGDGWLDLAVANDTQPNRLYRNQRDGTFTDVAVMSGMAFSEDGVARAGMGIDGADYDRSGRPSLIIGNFSNEMLALYHNEGGGLFIDEAPAAGIGRPSLLTLAFGCFFFDFDLDGLLDIFVANGHVENDINRVQPRVHHAQPPHLFWNRGDRRFEEVTERVGSALAAPLVGRGAAYGDIDNDGDLDLVVTSNAGPARLFRNNRQSNHRWLGVRLRGQKSNRDGIGTLLRATTGGSTQTALVRTGSSYLSQSQLAVVFGLAAGETVERLTVEWPSGTRQEFRDLKSGAYVLIDELAGIRH